MTDNASPLATVAWQERQQRSHTQWGDWYDIGYAPPVADDSLAASKGGVKYEWRALVVAGAAAERISALEAECERLRVDAARFRWLEPVWLPISSAPKDGTPVLVWFGRHGAKSIRWTDGSGDSSSDLAHWHVDDHKFGPFPVRGYMTEDTTHWMPLPAPPKGPQS